MTDVPYAVFCQADAWYFRCPDGSKSKRYKTNSAASDAATSRRQKTISESLARAYFTQRHIPLLILRVAFDELGLARLADFRVTPALARQIATVSLRRGSDDLMDAELPSAYLKHVSLFRDLMNLHWMGALDCLLVDCGNLV